MARPPLEIGTHGNIKTTRMTAEGVKPEAWRARCRFRDLDGETRPVERWGPSRTKATKALEDACQARRGAKQLTDTSRFNDLAAVYLKQIGAKRSGTTYDRYKSALDLHVIPAIGERLPRECTTARIQQLLDDLEAAGQGASSRNIVRAVIRGVMQIAVRRELVSGNPTRDLDRIEHGKRKLPRALSAPQVAEFLAKLDTHPAAIRSGILSDLARILFGTGMRIGEALALRWIDINLTSEPIPVDNPDGEIEAIPPHSIWVNGNVVYVSGQGVVRNPGKTEAANRVVGMPAFLVERLNERRQRMPAHATAPVFPSARHQTWCYPTHVDARFAAIRDDLGFPEFVTHWGRKTIGTLLDDAGQSARQVADQLGHADITVTQRHYMGRQMANPQAISAIDHWHRTARTNVMTTQQHPVHGHAAAPPPDPSR